jgi:ComF family protein
MIKMKIKFAYSWIKDVAGLLFPDICPGCGSSLLGNEHLLCLRCKCEIPLTHFDVMEGNPVEQIFWGRVPVKAATSYARFEKGGRVQHLLHALKYRGNKELGVIMGELMGEGIEQNSRFSGCDMVIPVPLHQRRQRWRGFNQSEMLAKGVAKAIQKPLRSDLLVRQVYTSTQTRKGRYQRWENVDGIFNVVNPDDINGKSVLLIDDVVTTGSTLEACASALVKHPGVKVSIMTFSFA